MMICPQIEHSVFILPYAYIPLHTIFFLMNMKLYGEGPEIIYVEMFGYRSSLDPYPYELHQIELQLIVKARQMDGPLVNSSE